MHACNPTAETSGCLLCDKDVSQALVASMKVVASLTGVFGEEQSAWSCD